MKRTNRTVNNYLINLKHLVDRSLSILELEAVREKTAHWLQQQTVKNRLHKTVAMSTYPEADKNRRLITHRFGPSSPEILETRYSVEIMEPQKTVANDWSRHITHWLPDDAPRNTC